MSLVEEYTNILRDLSEEAKQLIQKYEQKIDSLGIDLLFENTNNELNKIKIRCNQTLEILNENNYSSWIEKLKVIINQFKHPKTKTLHDIINKEKNLDLLILTNKYWKFPTISWNYQFKEIKGDNQSFELFQIIWQSPQKLDNFSTTEEMKLFIDHRIRNEIKSTLNELMKEVIRELDTWFSGHQIKQKIMKLKLQTEADRLNEMWHEANRIRDDSDYPKSVSNPIVAFIGRFIAEGRLKQIANDHSVQLPKKAMVGSILNILSKSKFDERTTYEIELCNKINEITKGSIHWKHLNDDNFNLIYQYLQELLG